MARWTGEMLLQQASRSLAVLETGSGWHRVTRDIDNAAENEAGKVEVGVGGPSEWRNGAMRA